MRKVILDSESDDYQAPDAKEILLPPGILAQRGIAFYKIMTI